ncbi:HD-GYP domain-containing protein [Niallia oryzisoli]|uniref:HD-GYP domain-containing protein n=1 Tax=Niallia oryzisoli TaxID=1737571 RepID=UPI0037354ECA
MNSKLSIILEKTFIYRCMLLILLPIYFFADQYTDTRETLFIFNLLLLILSSLSFRKVWIQAILSGVFSLLGEPRFSVMNLHMITFHWITSFTLSAFIMTLIEKYLNEKRNTFDLITSLAKSLDSRDEYTAFHSQNVANYARKIAEEMKLSPRICENIYMGGLLHDIGKIGIAEVLLNKPATLSEQEYKLIKQHPEIGYNMVKHIKRFKSTGILHMILHHHERYDGKGYPNGLKGDDIPLEARIMAVADAFDAMTSKRVYRNQLVWEDVFTELNQNKGSQFDPLVVNAFYNVFTKEGSSFMNKQANPDRNQTLSLVNG